jgi:hypothetical protein
MYTPREKAEMVLLHASGMSQRAIADGYHQRHPGQPRPSHHLIDDHLTRFKESGSVQDKPRTGRPRSATGLVNCVAVTAKVAASPQRSMRKSRRELLSVEVLSTGYFSGTDSTHTKHTSCRGYTAMTQTDVWNFVSGFRKHENSKTLAADIFFSDEACFHLSGTVVVGSRVS